MKPQPTILFRLLTCFIVLCLTLPGLPSLAAASPQKADLSSEQTRPSEERPGTETPDASRVIPPDPSRPVEIMPDELEASILSANGRTSLESGAPLALYGIGYRVNPATPEAMARQYLRENASLLHLKAPDLGDLTHRVTRLSHSGATVRFTQLVEGIPVYKSEIAVHINNDNTVTYVTNDYKSMVSAIDLTPTLAAARARQIAHDYLNAQGRLRYDQTTLFVYYNKGVARLAYQVKVVPETPLGDWEVLVDAHTGEIFKAVDISLSYRNHPGDVPEKVMVDGTGNVFRPDPLSSAHATYDDPGFTDGNDANTPQLQAELVNVTLPDIQYSGGQYTLIGPYAHIVDSESPYDGLFPQVSSTFNFNRFDNAFEAVNTYYHIDTPMRYLNVTLGVPVTPIQYTGGARYDPHGLNGDDNSHYMPSTGEVAFGEGGVDDAEDADVIYHELGHALHDWVTNGNLSQVNGLSEGCGDYWAQSYSRSLGQWAPTDTQYQWVFNWDGHNPFWDGRDTNSPDSYPGGLNGDIYHDGAIWSTCLMKVWDAIGRAQIDRALFEGLATTGSSTGQNDAANAVYQAAIDLGYSNADRYNMHTILSSCGYTLPPFVPDGVIVAKSANPSPVAAGEVLTYSLAVENTASDPHTGVVMSDDIPINTTYVPGSATCGGLEAGGTLTFSLGTLNAGAAVTCTFQVVVSAGLGGPVEVFSDDMESGGGNWTPSAGIGAYNWTLGTTNPHSPSHAWFAQDVSTISDQYLALSNPITLGDEVILSFWHSYNLESTYDGGVIEISVGGGPWADLGPFITQNGYDATISTSYGNPIGGRQAFTGNGGGYVETKVDLSSYAGDSVRIRFRLGTDNSTSGVGWYVDDVRLATAGDAIGNTACVASDQDTAFCDTISTPVLEPTLPPQIEVIPASLANTLPPNVQAGLPLTISNHGGQALSWTIEEDSVVTASRCDLPREDIAWASVAPVSGATTGGSQTPVVVTFNAAAMPAGAYTGTLCIDSNDPITPLVSIPLTLTVSSASDVGIHKSVLPAEATPGQNVTYTLSFSNSGNSLATGVVITDVMPGELSALSYEFSSGLSITLTGSVSYAWQAQNLAPGQGGVITITGQISLPLAAGVIDNMAQIAADQDGNSLNDSSSASFTVLNVAPSAADDDYTLDEDSASQALYVLANDGDENGDSLTIASITTPDHGGALSISTSTLYLVYTPAPNFFGLETFSYTVSDGDLTDTATVSVHITAINDAPALDVIGSQEVDEDSLLSFTATATDVDLDTLTFSLDAGSVGNITAGGVFTWTPTEAEGPGIYTATVRVSDGELQDTEMITITVNEVNTAPFFVSTPLTAAVQGALYSYAIVANDLDIPTNILTITAPGGLPAWLSLTGTSNGAATLGGTPTLADVGEHAVTLQVSDKGSLTGTQSFTITVSDATLPQVIATSPLDNAVNVTLTAPIVVTFSEAINAATFDYTLTPDPGGVAVVWNGDGTVATLSHTLLAYQTRYTVTVTAAQDLTGNELANAPYESSFSTVPQSITYHLIYLPVVMRNQ